MSLENQGETKPEQPSMLAQLPPQLSNDTTTTAHSIIPPSSSATPAPAPLASGPPPLSQTTSSAAALLPIFRTPYTLADALSRPKLPTKIKHSRLPVARNRIIREDDFDEREAKKEEEEANNGTKKEEDEDNGDISKSDHDNDGSINSGNDSDEAMHSDTDNDNKSEPENGEFLTFYKTDDHPFNKRGFKYKLARPNPYNTTTLYGTSDLPPYRARISYFDRSQGTAIDNSASAVTADGGWRSARANVGIVEGKWYFEYLILNAGQDPNTLDINLNDNNNNGDTSNNEEVKNNDVGNGTKLEKSGSEKEKPNPNTNVHQIPHVRVGIGRREASLDAPTGYDAYGYALRDVSGQTVHLSRPKRFMDEGFQSGDVLGMLVELPLLQKQREIAMNQVKHRTPGDPEDAERFFGKSDKNNAKSDEEHNDISHSIKKESTNSSSNSNNNKESTAAPATKKRKKTKKLEDAERDQIGDLDNHSHTTAFDIQRDQIPIKYKSETYYEQFEYRPTQPFEHLLNPVTVFGEKAISDTKPFKPATLPELRVTVYKNGQRMGVAFESLYAFLPPSSKLFKQQSLEKQYNDDGELGYFPMVSVFKNGVVQLNGGPDWVKLPRDEELRGWLESGVVRGLNERYGEKIAEDVVYDIIDEIECEYLEGNW